MPEQSPIERGGDIKLPSALRIRQRLGHVSTNKVFKRELVPKLMQLGGQSLPVEDAFIQIVHRVSTFSGNGESARTRRKELVPRVLNQLVQGDRHRLDMFLGPLCQWQAAGWPRIEDPCGNSSPPHATELSAVAAVEPAILSGSTPEELGIRARAAVRTAEREFTIIPPNLG